MNDFSILDILEDAPDHIASPWDPPKMNVTSEDDAKRLRAAGFEIEHDHGDEDVWVKDVNGMWWTITVTRTDYVVMSVPEDGFGFYAEKKSVQAAIWTVASEAL